MRSIAMAAVLAATSSTAAADPAVQFSGYGTMGSVVTDNDEANFVSSSRQHRGADKSPDLGVDSRLGLQAAVQFNSTFSGAAQVLTKRVDGSIRPRMEWLYLEAKPLSWLSVKAGRMVLPTFLVSDSRNVGYASHWLREPAEVYGQLSVTSYDGLQAQVRTEWAGTNFSLQLSGGKAKAKSYPQFTLDLALDKIRALNLVAERGDWTARIGRTQDTVSLTGFPFPVAPDKDKFTSVGLQFDNGQLLVMSEYAVRKTSSGGGDSSGYYVSGGWHFGPVMPYVTHSSFKPKGSNFNLHTTTGTNAVGVRWDAYKDVALKAQLESTNSAIQFVKTSPAFGLTQPKVTVLSLAADFVF